MVTKKNRAGMDAEAVARMVAAQEIEEAQGAAPEPVAPMIPAEPVSPPQAAAAPPFDPGKVDGRTLRKTFREPFATRVKPETHAKLRRLAFSKGISIAEALEQAVAAFEKPAS